MNRQTLLLLAAGLFVGVCAEVACAAKPVEAPMEFATDLAPGECRVAVAPPGAGENMLLCRTDPNPNVRCYWTPRRVWLGETVPAALSCVEMKP
jgi:hypothetical protein